MLLRLHSRPSSLSFVSSLYSTKLPQLFLFSTPTALLSQPPDCLSFLLSTPPASHLSLVPAPALLLAQLSVSSTHTDLHATALSAALRTSRPSLPSTPNSPSLSFVSFSHLTSSSKPSASFSPSSLPLVAHLTANFCLCYLLSPSQLSLFCVLPSLSSSQASSLGFSSLTCSLPSALPFILSPAAVTSSPSSASLVTPTSHDELLLSFQFTITQPSFTATARFSLAASLFPCHLASLSHHQAATHDLSHSHIVQLSASTSSASHCFSVTAFCHRRPLSATYRQLSSQAASAAQPCSQLLPSLHLSRHAQFITATSALSFCPSVSASAHGNSSQQAQLLSVAL